MLLFIYFLICFLVPTVLKYYINKSKFFLHKYLLYNLDSLFFKYINNHDYEII